jgi:D-glycero-alpha-D-manno-heptose-7-phosphate kinase
MPAGESVLIISRTPFRISFLGGGTDYPSWYRSHGGAVLATTINKYCYISCRYLPPFFEHRIRIAYSKVERCNAIDEIEHAAVREVLRYLKIDMGVEIHYDADLPARGGLGSSSAFVVGLLNAVYALKGHMSNKRQLALESIYVEQELLKETVGSQDQVMAAYGGFNHVTFLPNGGIVVNPVTISQERLVELGSHLMLFFTGLARTASEVAKSYVPHLAEKQTELRSMSDLVDEGVAILNSGQDICRFGELLHESWRIKHSLSSQVSNAYVDEVYAEARRAGALGGKLTGAGGGGFLLLFASPSERKAVRERLSKLLYIPFKMESCGSQIIFFDPGEDHSGD